MKADYNNNQKEFVHFYPDIIPPEDKHPTSQKFAVVETGDERGKGMQGKVAFNKDEYVAKLSGVLVSQTTLNTIQISSTLYFSDKWFCRYLLHSCNPNLIIHVDSLSIHALRDISPGEYLTIDYATTDDKVTHQFACDCGAPNCRKWITGRAEETNEEGRSLLDKKGI